MGNKYYVPEISEFHVGFEYEVLSLESDLQACVYIWEKEIFNTNSNIEGCKQTIDMGYIRVKYLDKEDIESLGWKYDNNMEPIPAREDINNELPLAFITEGEDSNKQWALFLFSDNIVWIDYTYKCGGEGYIFKGLIKNKSNLKKLMQQLNIK